MSLEEHLERIRSRTVPPNEESAKFQIIAPILESLGWSPSDGSEFLLEYPVGGKRGGRVDIALRSIARGQSRLLALIEAKAPGSDLSQHVGQVLGYAFHEGVDVCVLTTGLEWQLFLPRESGEPMQRRFAVLDLLNDPAEQVAEDLRAFLTKEALTKGRAEKKAKSVLKARLDADRLQSEIPKIWDRMLRGPDEELVELVGSRVYEKLNLRPHRDQVIAALGGGPVPMALETPAQQTPEVSGPKPSNEGRPSRRSKVPPTSIVLWGVPYQVARHKDVLCQVVDCLYERHANDNFDRILELRGRQKPYAALTPDGMHAHHRVKSSRYFLDAHGSAADLRRRAELFLATFGYDKSDLEVLFE
ncbi:MAG: hypothetical protein OXF75_13295 [Acidimicrobiaceae bacterium]|nr:hypothetical protein [Acidimicrobiaceae bacterium]